MFTGLIEEVGSVLFLRRSGSHARLGIRSSLSVDIGDSVAVNGACLTVVEILKSGFVFDVSEETLKRTNLGLLKPGNAVNLERALKVGDRLNGHIVQGHVDTVGRIEEFFSRGEHYRLRISFGTSYSVYTVEKGSIAVDGISLTVNRCGEGFVEINVIPHTFEHTNLKFRKRGDLVNLEFDVLGKYAVNYLQRIGKKLKTLEGFLNL